VLEGWIARCPKRGRALSDQDGAEKLILGRWRRAIGDLAVVISGKGAGEGSATVTPSGEVAVSELLTRWVIWSSPLRCGVLTSGDDDPPYFINRVGLRS
jgi:hypothetical protein